MALKTTNGPPTAKNCVYETKRAVGPKWARNVGPNTAWTGGASTAILGTNARRIRERNQMGCEGQSRKFRVGRVGDGRKLRFTESEIPVKRPRSRDVRRSGFPGTTWGRVSPEKNATDRPSSFAAPPRAGRIAETCTRRVLLTSSTVNGMQIRYSLIKTMTRPVFTAEGQILRQRQRQRRMCVARGAAVAASQRSGWWAAEGLGDRDLCGYRGNGHRIRRDASNGFKKKTNKNKRRKQRIISGRRKRKYTKHGRRTTIIVQWSWCTYGTRKPAVTVLHRPDSGDDAGGRPQRSWNVKHVIAAVRRRCYRPATAAVHEPRCLAAARRGSPDSAPIARRRVARRHG